ncbi:MAG: TIGR02253 family HAD-type hydrolase [Nitrospirota bacterium]
METSLKVVFFDIDDTFYSTTEFTRLARMNAIRAMIDAGLRVDEFSAFEELDKVSKEFGANYERHYDELITRLNVQLEVSKSVIIAAGVIAYHDTKVKELKPFPDVEWALSVLSRNKKLKLGIISDGLTLKQIEKIIRLGLLKYFNKEAMFFTEEMGIRKPNPLLFTRACEALKVRPQEVMYVGDHPTHDIDPANEAGVITVFYQRGGKHAFDEGKTEPYATIRDMMQLVSLLKERFKIAI